MISGNGYHDHIVDASLDKRGITMDSMAPTQARDTIATLGKSLTETNSSIALRTGIATALTSFDVGDMDVFASLIDMLAANICDAHDCSTQCWPSAKTSHSIWAKVDAFPEGEDPYHVLSDVRHRFGYLNLGRRASNVGIFR
jgi:hypothetical protein